MRLRRKFSRRQMFVVMTLALTAFLGALALGTDVAVIYLNWMQLRKAADSAALAGAAFLGPFAAAPAVSSSCSWGGVAIRRTTSPAPTPKTTASALVKSSLLVRPRHCPRLR
jgi:uncharacterized membrane protein